LGFRLSERLSERLTERLTERLSARVVSAQLSSWPRGRQSAGAREPSFVLRFPFRIRFSASGYRRTSGAAAGIGTTWITVGNRDGSTPGLGLAYPRMPPHV
jgi:hypothetical protein